MTNAKIGPRCTAEYLPDVRPLLAADASTRLGGGVVPVRDWRCVREPHSPATEHLALPAGVTGQSFRFAGVLVDWRTCPTTHLIDGVPCPDCLTHHRDDTTAPAAPRADPDDVRRLIELVQQPGSTAVHVNDGDELLLLLPEADDAAVQRSAQALADLFPTVSFLVLAGVTGAVVMPRRREATYDELIEQRDKLIMQGVDPADLAMPVRRLTDDQA